MMIGIGMPSIQSKIERPIEISFVSGDCKRDLSLEGCAGSYHLDDVLPFTTG